MLPFSIYRSLRADGAGNPVDLDAAEKGKTVLTVEGRKNILGVQGQLFAETIRSFNGVEYLLFPKIMGLAERGWNAYPAWEELRGAQEQQAFNKALALYYEKNQRYGNALLGKERYQFPPASSGIVGEGR